MELNKVHTSAKGIQIDITLVVNKDLKGVIPISNRWLAVVKQLKKEQDLTELLADVELVEVRAGMTQHNRYWQLTQNFQLSFERN